MSLRVPRVLSNLLTFVSAAAAVLGEWDGSQEAGAWAGAAAGALGGVFLRLRIFAWERVQKPELLTELD